MHHDSSPRGRLRRRLRRLPAALAAAAGAVLLASVSTTVAAAAPVGVPPSGVGGAVTAWGDNSSAQAGVPASLAGKTVTAVAPGAAHSHAPCPRGRSIDVRRRGANP